MLNSFTMIGNAGSDAETRYTKDNKPVTNISVALTEGWGDRKRTVWTKLRVIGAAAEFMGKVQKGDRVICSGAAYCVDEWDDKDGEKKRSHYFLAGIKATVSYLSKDGRPTESTQDERPAGDGAQGQRKPAEVDDDEELPF